jgi:hypothetical protein
VPTLCLNEGDKCTICRLCNKIFPENREYQGSEIALIVQLIMRKVFILPSLFDGQLHRGLVAVFLKKGTGYFL